MSEIKLKSCPFCGKEDISRRLIAMNIAINNCSRNTLCIDCDNTNCAFQGKKESDCPKWHCDRPDYAKLDCDHCGFIDKFIKDMRAMYNSESLNSV